MFRKLLMLFGVNILESVKMSPGTVHPCAVGVGAIEVTN